MYYGFLYNFNRKVLFIELELFTLNSIPVIITLLIDWIRLIFMGFVLIISSMVIIYSTSYMRGEVYFNRFIWLVYLFVLSIVLLIISPNMVRILLGWDGLGLVSYCLVIYYQNVKSSRAGILTILSNRVGDVAILLCISWIFNYGGWNFYYLPFIFRKRELIVVEFLVILAALTKRAQVPFSAWLPAAIAAPTPVSSLVHSSTLVTAGVYLLIRFRNLIGVRVILLLISIWTIIMSGINANLEIDLKKIIALSTLRQLGVIIITISLGLIEIAFFHLLSHALFKSLLFLCAGVFIHGMGDIQDIRDLGGVRILTPVTSLYFFGCSISLCGFPFLSGFYSKDIILENYFIQNNLGVVVYFLIILRILLTGLYSTRLGYFLFFKPLGVKKFNTLEEENLLIYPIRLLFLAAVVRGSLIIWWFVPPLLISLPVVMKLMILFLTVVFFVLVLSMLRNLVARGLDIRRKVFLFFGGIINIPILSTIFLTPALSLGSKILKNFDQGWLEFLGGQGFIGRVSYVIGEGDKLNYLNLKLYLFLFFLIVGFVWCMRYLDSL